MIRSFWGIRFFIVIFIFAQACQDRPVVVKPEELGNATRRQVVVEDFMHAGRYTYLRVRESGSPFWMAVNAMEVNKEDTLYYEQGVMMLNFESKELKRFFDTLYLVNIIGDSPTDVVEHFPKGVIDPHGDRVIPLPSGGIRLNELFHNSKTYAGKKVKIAGDCTKVNPNIMDQNWVHVQDGTTNTQGEILNLTVVTQALPQVGDMVVFEGTIVLDKDFGSGYQYAVLMEDANLVK